MKSTLIKMCCVAVVGSLMATDSAVAQSTTRMRAAQVQAPTLNQPKTSHPTTTRAAASTGDGTMKIRLKRGFEIGGTPIDLKDLKVSGLVGQINVPVHTIAGIRFPKKAGEMSTIILHNGDSLTGEVAMSQLKLVSQWGEAAVNTQEIDYVMFRDDLAWGTASTLAGNRWTLSKSSRIPATGGTTANTATTRPTYRNGF